MEYSIPKGVFDILPQEPHKEDAWRNSAHWEYIEKIIRELARDYGCREIRTPIFERTELFVRSVGETSDIVTKEMYTFTDKADRSLTLRPEGTAPVIRAFVEKQLHLQRPIQKFFYIAPMFRYERPQAGRYRQHHQFGMEAIGVCSAEQDVEVIDLLTEFYRRVGLKNLKVAINTLGDLDSRTKYREALHKYFEEHLDRLSPDSQARFSRNIMRILDSKSPEDQEFIASAPSILDFLSTAAKSHFEKVCTLLSSLGLAWEISPRLVRGLDYYNHTVFEVSSGQLGAQNALGGGGRYDGLIASLGGPDIPSVGFGTGLERVMQTMERQGVQFPSPQGPFIYFIPLGSQASEACMKWTAALRHARVAAEVDLSGKKLQTCLQTANLLQAAFCLVIGEDEQLSGKAQLKEMATHQSKEIVLDDLVERIIQYHQEKKGKYHE